jgi:hypothetical protein
MMWSKHSRRIDPINRSAKPFCQGEDGAIGLSRIATLNPSLRSSPWMRGAPVCTENLIHVDEVTESPKLVE